MEQLHGAGFTDYVVFATDQEDSQKTAIGCIAPLAEISTPQTCPKFDKLINELARDAKWHAVFEAAHR
jgi:hypothetical protein